MPSWKAETYSTLTWVNLTMHFLLFVVSYTSDNGLQERVFFFLCLLLLFSGCRFASFAYFYTPPMTAVSKQMT